MSEIQTLIQIGRRNWWIVALTAGAALLISIILSSLTTPTYMTSARFIVSPNRELEDRDIINSLEALDKRSVVVTYAEVLRSNRILGSARQELNVAAVDLADYSLTAVVLPEANVLELTITGPDPALTANLANVVGEKAIEYMSSLYPIHLFAFLDKAPVPQRPFEPQPVQNAILSVALGLGLGGLLVVLRERLLRPTAVIATQETDTQKNNPTELKAESTPNHNQAAAPNGSVHDFEITAPQTK
ncbi:MAG: hypothetical protein H6667_19935 [Ardenticatenaceae bacterium]|nr:hypothetical protein [Ardenticatenaceae bacterium]MCB9443919.1 hypothetical protein [Ardenticatenaceae bacterium]